MFGAALAATAQPAAAVDLICVVQASVNWNVFPPQHVTYSPDEAELGELFEYWIDTVSGEWQGRHPRSRALTSGGGRLVVANDGTGYRNHWVGVDAEAGRETMHLQMAHQPITFMRVTRDGFGEMGTCAENSRPDGLTP